MIPSVQGGSPHPTVFNIDFQRLSVQNEGLHHEQQLKPSIQVAEDGGTFPLHFSFVANEQDDGGKDYAENDSILEAIVPHPGSPDFQVRLPLLIVRRTRAVDS